MNIQLNSGTTATAANVPKIDHRLAYSVSEAANVTGLGRTTLYALMRRGELASCKVGKRRIISAAALEALVAGQGPRAFHPT